MITMNLESIYHFVGIIAICCSAAYKIGYEIGKSQKK